MYATNSAKPHVDAWTSSDALLRLDEAEMEQRFPSGLSSSPSPWSAGGIGLAERSDVHTARNAYPTPFPEREASCDRESICTPSRLPGGLKRTNTRLPRDLERKQPGSRPAFRIHGSRKHERNDLDSTALIRSNSADRSVPITIPKLSQHRAHRQQLLNNVIVSAGPRSSLAVHTSTITYVRELDLSTPILQAALDSFMYGELAFRYSDAQSLSHAHAAYGSALSLLGRELFKPSSQTPPARRTAVLTAIMLLIYCTTFNEVEGARVKLQSQNASHAHIQGGIRYILSGQALPTSAYDWVLVQQLRHPSFWHSLFVGVPDPFASEEWMKAAEERDLLYSFCSADRSYMRLHDILQTLPGLYQRIGRLLNRKNRLDGALQLFQEAQRFREKLRAWVTEQIIDTGTIGYEVVPGATFPRFFAKFKDSLYKTTYGFGNVWAAIFYCTEWYACAVINTCMLDILKLKIFDEVMGSTEEASITQDQIKTSQHICCAMPYCFEHNITLPYYPPAFAFLQAKAIFAQQRMELESRWCEDAQGMFDVQPASLQWVIEGAKTPPFQKRQITD
ncbi:hypothetical protein K431DRAFT_303127 [Polychaeton citri CBS 116435]|uniref:Uncharacterized protein n=1 Tax=Polychaeton citri CBS 116435 TaxID=1314669 RepID=A0A9P4QBL4_9PEZI|nr:hypothetical protein K431DRAFT_303127 [Polychaeton citri CBS 116435]